ncbi:MAG: serine protease [Planctomycetaceae bacterium]|nr:MAG: serine protease [Planctomycetaceae bacterium]
MQDEGARKCDGSRWLGYGGWVLAAALGCGVGVWWMRASDTVLANAPQLRAHDLSLAFRSVAEKCLPSIVSIEAISESRQVEVDPRDFFEDDLPFPFREFFRNDPRFREMFPAPRRGVVPRRQAAGSGFIIDSRGIIMTNNHVVEGADRVKVRLYDGREFIAKEVKTDPRTDVAIVVIEAQDLQPLKLGDSRQVQIGDWVLAFGSPFGLEMTVTQGIISGKGRSRGLVDREDFLQTDAAINPGNSGGPLVNLDGEVIGINTAIASASGGYDGIGFAIPAHIARWVADQLIRSGVVKRGYLGIAISELDASTAKQFGAKVRQGVLVREVRPNSPADKAGVQPGDIILSVNQQPVTEPTELQGVVEQLTIGKSYPLQVLREGRQQTLQVTIEEMPESYTARSRPSPSRSRPEETADALGLQVRPVTKELAQQFNLPADAKGVVVVRVQAGGLAEQVGINVGDLIERVGNTPIASLEDYQQAIKTANLSEGVVLYLRNAQGRRFVVVQSSTSAQ